MIQLGGCAVSHATDRSDQLHNGPPIYLFVELILGTASSRRGRIDKAEHGHGADLHATALADLGPTQAIECL